MSDLLVSVIIGHYNRDRDLARLLRCLSRQTYYPIEVIVTADGSPPPKPFLWYGKPAIITELIFQEEWPVRWVDFPRAESGRPRVNGCINDAVHDYTRGKIICLLHEDWWLEDAWIEKMAQSLLERGPGNHIVGVQKNFRHQIKGGWPYEAHVAPLPNPGFVDSGLSSMLFREDWVDWDEDFDVTGFGHSVPYWGFLCYWAGQHLWYNSTVHMKHIPHAREAIMWSNEEAAEIMKMWSHGETLRMPDSPFVKSEQLYQRKLAEHAAQGYRARFPCPA